ncbi:penicillin-binding protein 1C [Iodidimonas sp. SYSU 1G8]|uniref:penicillin-binding protein 1C n=1 Tax=Iodidimonas sp. SYSU 1G8 TaxID=3133967 RepID=UPI0031FE75A6
MTRRRLFLLLPPVVLVAALAAVLFWPVSMPSYKEVREAYRPSEAYLLDREGRVIAVKRVDFGIRRLDWVPLDGMSPALKDAIVAGEDRRFQRHGGVDWTAAAGAVWSQLSGGARRGGSTITMQVAGLIDPGLKAGGRRGWRQKLAQMRAANSLERHWSKPQILEAYLNLLDFRGELQGIGATARFLSGKHPSGLGTSESLVLAALLPSPGASSERVAARACARARLSDCAEIRAVAARLLDNARARMAEENLAPQLGNALLRQAGERRRTTLDLDIQRVAVEALDRHLGGLTQANVRDGAVLVVDNLTGQVLAYVASGGGLSRSAQVDGIRAPRQAGSTLKPFLYGLALERRYLTPASLLDDSPLNLQTALGMYIPQNYDRDFKGMVSVRTALASSLNVPAVRTLVLVGVEAFRDRLHSAGYAGIDRDGEYYGYSLALGSAEVTLWEQVTAYRALARGGLLSSLTVSPDAAVAADSRVMSEASAFLVSNILSDRAARITTFGLANTLNTRFWSAVKTGTSKDMRDNWCIGYSRRYTVGVWVGNFEGDSMHNVSGVSGAAPIWQDVISQLARDETEAPPVPPGDVVASQVRFSPAVETPREDWFLKGTEIAVMEAVPAGPFARIVSPADGVVVALDPDIPASHTRVPIRAEGGDPSLVLKIGDRVLGPATRDYLWAPRPGTHLVVLQRADGSVADKARITVRDVKAQQK